MNTINNKHFWFSGLGNITTWVLSCSVYQPGTLGVDSNANLYDCDISVWDLY